MITRKQKKTTGKGNNLRCKAATEYRRSNSHLGFFFGSFGVHQIKYNKKRLAFRFNLSWKNRFQSLLFKNCVKIDAVESMIGKEENDVTCSIMFADRGHLVCDGVLIYVFCFGRSELTLYL